MRPNQRQPRAAIKAKPEKALGKGATQAKTTLAHKVDSYVGHHSVTAVESLERLFHTPLQSLMTWLVIAVALALPASLYTGLQNLQAVGQQWDGDSHVSVFLKPGLKPAGLEALMTQLNNDTHVLSVVYISPAQALKEFEQQTGLGDALSMLEQNPLPPALIIQPKPFIEATALAAFTDELRQQPVIDDVVIDLAWVQRLQQILAFAQRLVLALGVLLAAGVILVVGNTIRLAIENRRDEIVIIKLVGGTDAFVRRPFLYTGLWYGVGGGILASLLLMLALFWLSGPVQRLSSLYQSEFALTGLGFSGSVALVLLAGLTGWLGAWLAVGRHLGSINPS